MSLRFFGCSAKPIGQARVMLDATHDIDNARLRKFPFALTARAGVTASLGFRFPPVRARELPSPVGPAASGVGALHAGIADLLERVHIGAPVFVFR
jgi:hypothetical protein